VVRRFPRPTTGLALEHVFERQFELNSRRDRAQPRVGYQRRRGPDLCCDGLVTSLDHPAISKLAIALREAGMGHAADAIRILDDEVRTAAAAARALGVAHGAIANSLVFRTTQGEHDVPLLALTSGAHRADPDRLAELTGARQVAMADPAFVREHTGQPIGGVAPVGHPAPVRTIVDQDLERYQVVWAAAGHPKAVFPTTFAELITLTGGVAAAVTSEEEDGAL
jgi:prolyl-tRNA editing enzyme YbaK/EbsC (Cys-tRNA(Pro) deacylase)